MSENEAKSVACTTCGAPLPDAEPGKTVTCSHCKSTNMIPAAPPAPKADSFVMITASKVTAKRIVGHDLVETHHHHGDEAASSATIDLACPYCHRVTDEDAKAGRRYICGACGEKSFITANGKVILEWAVAVTQGLVPGPKTESGGFLCPNCQTAVAVKKVKPGGKVLCLSCKTFSQVSADGVRLEATVMPSGDVGGKGEGVNIKTDGDLSTGGDVTGRFKGIKASYESRRLFL